MKKKIIFIVFIAFVIVMCIPATEYYDDGGTIKYNAILWSVTKHHSMTYDSDGNSGYNIGTTIRIFCFEVYSDYPKFVEV
ncbi:MAG: hypothetical protein NC177_06265 [Ruminococcus flavefaciens]|nr:hypothetical protein [Ruminococcus flavefaciens]